MVKNLARPEGNITGLFSYLPVGTDSTPIGVDVPAHADEWGRIVLSRLQGHGQWVVTPGDAGSGYCIFSPSTSQLGESAAACLQVIR